MENFTELNEIDELEAINGGGTMGVVGGGLMIAGAVISGGGLVAVGVGVAGGALAIVSAL